MATRMRTVAVGLTALALGVALARSQQPTERPRANSAAPPTPVAVPAPAPAADPQARLTETVGMLSGLYLYQTYLTIGLLADGKAERVYDDRAARAVLASVVAPLDAVDKKMEALAAAVQTAADKDALARLRTTVALLRRQGGELAVFWNTGRPEDGARYEATRQEAWKWVVAVVGLDKKN